MKDPVKKNKGKATICEIIFANLISDEELISRICKKKNSSQNSMINKPSNKKMGKRHEETLPRRYRDDK